MIEIFGDNADDLFVNIARRLLKDGHRSSPRGKETLELEDVWLTLADPKKSVVQLPARGLNRKYLNAELNWYLHGSYDVEEIGKHSKFWYGLQDKDGKVNSNYGQIICRDLNKYGLNQFDWVIDRLKKDKETRQAVLVYNQPNHKSEDVKDFPCTLSQLFRVRDNKLESTVMMRSNDLIFGLSYDMPWFTMVQQMVANNLGLDVGKYQHFAASLHVYEKHFGMLEDIANKQEKLFE